ncbi:lantibiotic immunity ABC transporter MutE/EpiE family permease subunit [Clostridium sp. C2-6-12]|uniref:lantibiotic immunity ABC transporter MutE/EpiE family permease subunit n=1 Tax=Clostridium sp. C2-6-12 TaxID=2698832 RepID=UPI001369DC18|nr:lantibiotic immunity ABC transporter MutE/EpiE family permease subunit [Clostridium sp. C2-6-12]
MLQYFLSEDIKIKHTFMQKLIWLSPALLILLSMSLTASYFQVDTYNWWYTWMLSGTLSLSCVYLSRVDGAMKNRATISLPLDLKKVWIAKVFVGIKNISISCVIIFVAAQLSVFIIPINSIVNIPIFSGFIGTIIIIVTCIWQVPLCMFLGSKIGMFPTIILNLGINIFSIIMSVGKYWWVNPFTYCDRFLCPVLKILPNGLPAEPGNPTFTPELLNTSVIPLGIGISIILFLIITYLTAKWYEGKEAI